MISTVNMKQPNISKPQEPHRDRQYESVNQDVAFRNGNPDKESQRLLDEFCEADDTKLLEAISRLMPSEKEVWDRANTELKPEQFIRQLKIIDAPIKACEDAVKDALKAKFTRLRWGRNGISKYACMAYLDDVEKIYTDVRMTATPVENKSDSEKRDIGREIYGTCMGRAGDVKFNGQSLVDRNIGRGVLHQFADGEREVGWHPDWRSLI